jgi:hypothetical protein
MSFTRKWSEANIVPNYGTKFTIGAGELKTRIEAQHGVSHRRREGGPEASSATSAGITTSGCNRTEDLLLIRYVAEERMLSKATRPSGWPYRHSRELFNAGGAAPTSQQLDRRRVH